jgi:hypothetical protein
MRQHRRCYSRHRLPGVSADAACCEPIHARAEWCGLLGELAPVFARRSAHRLFMLLACGLILADRGTVTGMAAAARIGRQWRRACARHRRRRLPRGIPGHQGHDLDHAAAVQRGHLRAEAAANRAAGPAPGAGRPDRHLPGRRRRGLARRDRPGLRQGAARAGRRVPGLWYGSFKGAPGQLVPMREPGWKKPYDLGIFTLDTRLSPEQAIKRYSWRWPIEYSVTQKDFRVLKDPRGRRRGEGAAPSRWSVCPAGVTPGLPRLRRGGSVR